MHWRQAHQILLCLKVTRIREVSTVLPDARKEKAQYFLWKAQENAQEKLTISQKRKKKRKGQNIAKFARFSGNIYARI